jgi:hypothetical protein
MPCPRRYSRDISTASTGQSAPVVSGGPGYVRAMLDLFLRSGARRSPGVGGDPAAGAGVSNRVHRRGVHEFKGVPDRWPVLGVS